MNRKLKIQVAAFNQSAALANEWLPIIKKRLEPYMDCKVQLMNGSLIKAVASLFEDLPNEMSLISTPGNINLSIIVRKSEPRPGIPDLQFKHEILNNIAYIQGRILTVFSNDIEAVRKDDWTEQGLTEEIQKICGMEAQIRLKRLGLPDGLREDSRLSTYL